MARLSLLFAFLVNIFRVLARRLKKPPLRKTWTVRYEALARTLQASFAHAQTLAPPERRAYVDGIALPSLAKSGVTMNNVLTGGVPAMWVTPKGAAGPARPLIVYFHGGGYQFGSLEAYTDLLARLAVASKARVLGIDYRLAPEFPYPAALDDALAVVHYLRENGHKDLVFAGDGAGGNLVLATTLRLRELNEPLPLRVAPICPWVDMASTGIEENYAFDTVPTGALADWSRAFLAGTDPASPRVSPLRADLFGLPPMLIQAGGAEVTHADTLAFAKKAREEGVEVTLTDYEDMISVWHLLAPMGVPQAQKAINELGTFLGRPLASPASPASPASNR